MGVGEFAWFLVERALPLLLVVASLPLLAGAVLAQAFGGPAWELFVAGIGCWAGGILWGMLVNRVGPAMARY